MFISGVSSLAHSASATAQIRPQPLSQLFQQLEQAALQAGTAAPTTPQSTFLTPPSGSPIAQALAQFSQSGTAGNTPQQDYSAPQTVPGQTAQTHSHLHHHHGGGGGSNALSQLFEQLGQDLQSGNLAEAQQAYGALVSDLPQMPQSSVTPTAQSNTSGVSVTT